MRRVAVALICSTLVIGCVSNRDALAASKVNVAKIKNVQLGQTMAEVWRTMGHDPEIRSAEIRDGIEIERWSYVTDYENDVMTTIRFEDKRVTGIETESWDGAWSRDTLPDDFDMTP